jgi:hypothetical protein
LRSILEIQPHFLLWLVCKLKILQTLCIFHPLYSDLLYLSFNIF